MAKTAAERLARTMEPDGDWHLDEWRIAVRIAQRAIAAGWVQRDDLIARGWTPPPDPWEAIARDVWLFLFPGGEWLAPEFESQRSLVRYMRETITKAEARTIAARIEEGT
jgi:hypothetical protein